MLYGTEPTVPCANPSQNEYGRCPLGETLPQIGAMSLFTDRMQVCLSQYGLDLFKILKGWDSLFQPGRLSHTIENCKLKNEKCKFGDPVRDLNTITSAPACGRQGSRSPEPFESAGFPLSRE
jgi:hypothetical protein